MATDTDAGAAMGERGTRKSLAATVRSQFAMAEVMAVEAERREAEFNDAVREVMPQLLAAKIKEVWG